ncbi:MAG: FHIPEP family type III secretion protein, partial [Desulfatiglandales bacterium]
GILSLGTVGKVLRNLLREQVPIRDITTILETLADYGQLTKDPDMLTELVRQSLSRTITRLHHAPDGLVYVLSLDQRSENTLLGSLQHTDQGSFVSVDPSLMDKLLESINKSLHKFLNINQQPTIICSQKVRAILKRLLERFVPGIDVISYNEISPGVQIKSIGTVGFTDAD